MKIFILNYFVQLGTGLGLAPVQFHPGGVQKTNALGKVNLQLREKLEVAEQKFFLFE